MDVDGEDNPTNFELFGTLQGSQVDAFTTLKDYLKAEEKIKQLVVNCDFSVLE